MRITSASLSFPKIGLTGTIAPTTTPTGIIPGLSVRQNGFTLGEPTIVYGGTPQSGETAGNPTPGGNGKIGVAESIGLNGIRVGLRHFEGNVDTRNAFH